MKLLTTSSADIIQECRVMFDVKSVSKSIFKCRRNVLPVVVDYKMANIRGIKSFTRTQLATKSGALSCRLMHSCSAMDRHMEHAVFHTFAFLAFSCLAFSTPQSGAENSCLAFSTLAFWCRIFMSRNFMSRIFSVPWIFNNE